MRSNLLLLFTICLCTSCKKDNQLKRDTIKNEEITQILFSKTDVAQNKVSQDDFVNTFTLHKNKFLSLHFSLEQPLIESLKKLAPNLSEEELLSIGNFQFSFLVDGETTYVENLNTGAGTKIQKTKELNKVVRLVTPEQIGFWGWFMWRRFITRHSGQEVWTKGKHNLTIEIRSYINDDTLKVSGLLAKGSISVEVPEIEIDNDLIAIQKIKPNSGWEVSKDNFDRRKIENLNRSIAEASLYGIEINGLVVLKDGKLLIEQYFNGSSRDSLHDVRSVGKSFASTMMGIAIDENYIPSEDAKLKDYYELKSFKNYTSKKDSVTLKSLLTMTSGFLGDDSDNSNPGNEENMYPTDNWVKFGLDLPMHQDKIIGQDYNYFTAGVVVLGDIIHKSVPNGLASYADKNLFAPLNIKDYKWQYTPQNVASTAGGIQLRAIDLAKYGQLNKNEGKWNNQQIVSSEWVRKSLTRQVSQAYAGKENLYYGYLFWNKTFTVNDTDYEVSFCTGNGGNKIFVFKDIPFVVVITASAYGNPNGHATVDTMMMDYIIPAITNITSRKVGYKQ
ncbi:serine hydrolase [Flagellimonas sp. DF-77]|uniref:serine hydrolase domain-containing protein n=1 Tax=Flagellimonas algarum TaxID=3230298 RepID=UPI00339739C0